MQERNDDFEQDEHLEDADQLEFNFGDVQEVESEFGESVKRTRTRMGLSQRAFAQRLTDAGLVLDASAISRIEQGKRAVRLGEAAVIANALDVDLDDLVYGGLVPERQLQSYRRDANQHMSDARRSLFQMLEAFRETDDFLAEYPDLVSELADETSSAPESVEEYLDWVADRMNGLSERDVTHGAWRGIFEDDQTRAAQLGRLLASIVAGLIAPGLPPVPSESVVQRRNLSDISTVQKQKADEGSEHGA